MRISTMRSRGISVAAILICAATKVSAGTIAITNYSFEADTVNSGSYRAQLATGWAFSGFVSTYYPSSAEITNGAPDGFNVIAVQGGSTLSQILTATLQPYTRYTLTTRVGERNDITSGGYTIALNAGANQLASDASTTLLPGGFITSTVTFVTTGADPGLGQALSINVAAQSYQVAGVGQTEFDLFQLDATPTGAPEPASFLLFGTGAGVLAIFRRKAFSAGRAWSASMQA